MRASFSALLVSSLLLTACGGSSSSLNPFGWFGRSTSEPVAEANTNPLIPTRTGIFQRRRESQAAYLGSPFEQVTDLRVERVPGGAIIRATGLAARQGIYAVQLTPATDDEKPVDGVLTYRLEGIRPSRPTPVGTKPTREVIAARHVTDQDLRGVRSIRVEGLKNARVVRR